MKLSTKRKIYYTSVIISLIAILVSAVVINRTLINTPKIDIETISDEAGEPVSAYMAYVDENNDIVVGIAEESMETAREIIEYIKSVPLETPIEIKDGETKVVEAWVVLYDSENRIASRMNFYNGGELIWYDGESYEGVRGVMEKVIEYCDGHKEDEKEEAEESPIPESMETPKGQE